MAGSYNFLRTPKDQTQYAIERAKPNELIQIAIVYEWTKITIYRNGETYAEYDVPERRAFQRESNLLIGKRHPYDKTTDPPTLAGKIEEVRLYGMALTSTTIAALRPNRPSRVGPIACWNFEDGTARDSTGHFPMGELRGNAKIRDGKLILDGSDSYLFVPSTLNETKIVH
jgi:hypothetical protein